MKLESPGPLIRSTWEKLSPLPGGKFLFSKSLGLMIPYTGSIKGIVKSFQPGQVIVEMHDRRSVRNHLASVHAIALTNLGEFSTGLAIISTLPAEAKAILVGIQSEFLKKARGKLEAHASFVPQTLKSGDQSLQVTANILNAAGETVTRVTATWNIRMP